MFIGKFLLINFATKLIKKYKLIRLIDAAIKEEGLKLLLLLRLCPLIPHNYVNYALGCTDVKFKDYLIGTLGMLPASIVYVFIGTTISDLAHLDDGLEENE